MIEYYKGAFNFNLLFRVHGSAVYRAMLTGLIAVGFHIWLTLSYDVAEPLGHPTAIGTLVGSITLLIVFKANQAYIRHWEAYTAVFSMMSRFQDALHQMVSYHMQCDHYIGMRPPSYFDHFELNNCFLTRDRERYHELSEHKDVKVARSIRKSINYVNDEKKQRQSQRWDSFEQEAMVVESERVDDFDEPEQLHTTTRLDGGWGKLFPNKRTKRPTATYYHPLMTDHLDKKGFASIQGGRTPALYLQEVVHLVSLLNAVALSTLRNDVGGAESPLAVYEPGSVWPEVDPAKFKKVSLTAQFQRFVGADGTAAARTKYNASRPLTVVGGVSNAEIRQLQMARGPYAKTQLAWNWVSEFMVREHLAGSTGMVGDALISRTMQFLGNGMFHYNQARKVMIIPFPFPHAQIAVFFTLVIIPGVPLLMYQYTLVPWLGSVLSFFVVTCLVGLHEVSRELENPFRKPPNEVPICTLQAQFNEALITSYSGYHPDAYFDDSQSRRRSTARSSVSLFMSSATSDRSLNSSSGIIPEGDEGEETDDDMEFIVEDSDEIKDLQSEIDEHAREMQRLRKTLDEKIKVQLAQKVVGAIPKGPSQLMKAKSMKREEEPVR